MKIIPVGVESALVDDEDYSYLCHYRWSLGTKGEAKTNVRGDCGVWHVKRMHQFLLFAPYGFMIDRINGNSLNNRKENLRVVTNGQNRTNSGPSKNNTLGFKGIYPHGGKFQVQVFKNGKLHNEGTFSTLAEAIVVSNEAFTRLHGEHGRLNPTSNPFEELF